MSFKITIVNNENGEVMTSVENAKAIIGAITTDEHTQVVGVTNCTTNLLLNALNGVDNAKKEILKRNPLLKLYYTLKDIEADKDTKTNED